MRFRAACCKYRAKFVIRWFEEIDRKTANEGIQSGYGDVDVVLEHSKQNETCATMNGFFCDHY